MKVYAEHAVLALAVDEGRCHGIMALDQTRGKLVRVGVRATLFAAGGYRASTSIPPTP